MLWGHYSLSQMIRQTITLTFKHIVNNIYAEIIYFDKSCPSNAACVTPLRSGCVTHTCEFSKTYKHPKFVFITNVLGYQNLRFLSKSSIGVALYVSTYRLTWRPMPDKKREFKSYCTMSSGLIRRLNLLYSTYLAHLECLTSRAFTPFFLASGVIFSSDDTLLCLNGAILALKHWCSAPLMSY